MSTQLCCRENCPFAAFTYDLCDLEGVSCVAYCKARDALTKHFGFAEFRPGQLAALMPVLHGKDVLVKMATGAGKSLCMYLVPLAVGTSAVGVVISPLNGLMDQQVKQLNDVGVPAIRVKGSEKFDEAVAGEFRFVLMSPESAVSPPWRGIFKSSFFREKLAVVAIDEAHCIPEWGSDFRKSFSRLGGLRALTTAPFMALTASAPPEIEATIISSLHLREPIVVTCPLDRPNIYLSTCKSVGLKRDLGQLTQLIASTENLALIPKTIIFSHTKDQVYKVFSLLSMSAKHKHSVSMYHASQSVETKHFIQSTFRSPTSELRCLSATIAFGMGMDIPDVELVVVNGPPETLSQLYQMFGRAGRNGTPARAHLLYTSSQLKQVKDPSLLKCCGDACKENCYRRELLFGLGSKELLQSNAACCDVCTGGKVPTTKLDVLVPTPLKRARKPKPVRDVNKEMEQKLTAALVKEKDKILEEFPGFRMLGGNFILSDAAIEELVLKAPFIVSKEDLNDVLLLRPEYRDRFFNVIWDILLTAPPPNKKQRKR